MAEPEQVPGHLGDGRSALRGGDREHRGGLHVRGAAQVRLQAAKNTAVYLTGAGTGAPLTLQNSATDGSQDWQLVAEPPTPTPTATTTRPAQSPTPSATATSAPAPAVPPSSASVSPSATVAPGTGGGTGGGLPLTGSPVAAIAGLGATAVVLGAAAMFAVRRRRIRFGDVD
ncbi:LPXTG cell wall anchor domain-containing protein [Actinoplanes sichuanensis]|uniref:LPXTG cell wall anchor domain-containing protein n=1 Tax=Actinoplanes sichuanensis TaxID=512349 RepID=A0ABW4A9A4_9ACTN|nr:LPXTG cell wall anchor domain-containing protein [Actinoplanes sichuanensis]